MQTPGWQHSVLVALYGCRWGSWDEPRFPHQRLFVLLWAAWGPRRETGHSDICRGQRKPPVWVGLEMGLQPAP